MSPRGHQHRLFDDLVDWVEERPVDDYYKTPRWLVDQVLDWIPLHGSILDAGAGEGVLSEAVQCASPLARITAVEVHPGRCSAMRENHPDWDVVEGDFFSWAKLLTECDCTSRHRKGCPRKDFHGFDGVIMNPPFKLKGDPRWPTTWDSFVMAGRELLKAGCPMLVIGFANVIGGEQRINQMHRQHPPRRLYWSSRRPNYRSDSSSGAQRDTVVLEYTTGRTPAWPGPPVIWL